MCVAVVLLKVVLEEFAFFTNHASFGIPGRALLFF
jgi:hypothetical protein